MFLDEVHDLKDRHPDRFRLLHVLSREEQDAELLCRAGSTGSGCAGSSTS